MKKYRSVDISEARLEDLIRRAPELIESGIEYVDHQVSTERGPLDVLLVDSGGSLVIAELKVLENDAMLVQAIDYYDYVIRNLEGYARVYGEHNIDPSQEPRLFLIAPGFSITLLNRIKWIDIQISLFTFQCIEFEDTIGEIIPIYKEVTAPTVPEQVEAYSLEERLSYITDSEMRTIAEELIAEIQGWGPDSVLVEAIKYSVSIKLSGRVVAYLEPRRKHFLVGTYDSDGKWTSQPIKNRSDVENCLPLVAAQFERVGGTLLQ
jgi:hypothetical protein